MVQGKHQLRREDTTKPGDDEKLPERRAGYASAVGTVGTVLSFLLGIGSDLLPSANAFEHVLIWIGCGALALASWTGYGAWQSRARFTVTAVTVVIAVISLALLVIAVRSPHRGHANADPSSSSRSPSLSPAPSPKPTPRPTHTSTPPLKPAFAALTPSPAWNPIAYPVNAVSANNDTRRIAASEVSVAFGGGCSAWLDNDGSGNLVGMLNTFYLQSCDAKVHRSDENTVNLAASHAAERTTALPDVGYTMWICVWQPGDQADQRCSPKFAMNGDTPAQA